ncbi:MAG: TolC family protein [Ignavibacteriales bacterium]|nr:TolC family protein [Ignavibacteriales bacterium]
MNKYFILAALALFISKLNGQTEINQLSLNEAIEIGVRQNPEILQSAENINAAKGRFWKGISLPQPELELSLEYAPVNTSLSNYSERTLAISQSFEFPTNYFLKGNKYSKEEEIALEQFLLKKYELVKQIKSAYFKVLADQSIVKYSEENLIISDDFYKKAQIRYNVGEGTNIEELTAKVQLSEAKNKLEIAKNNLNTSLAELNYVLGYGNQNKTSSLLLTDSLIYTEHNFSLETVYQTAEETNPQIKEAKLNNGIAGVEKTLAWSSLLPNFNFAYFKQSRDGDNGFYGASFGVSVPLWFIMDQRGAIQEASANESISEALLQQTKNEIRLKLKNAYTSYINNQQQIKTYNDDILPQTEEVYRTAIKSYDAGELSYLEYMQVKQLVINARENYITALFNYNNSLFELEEIIGKNIYELENKND